MTSEERDDSGTAVGVLASKLKARIDDKAIRERRKASVCCMYSHDTQASNILPTNRTVEDLRFVLTVRSPSYVKRHRRSAISFMTAQSIPQRYLVRCCRSVGTNRPDAKFCTSYCSLHATYCRVTSNVGARVRCEQSNFRAHPFVVPHHRHVNRQFSRALGQDLQNRPPKAPLRRDHIQRISS
jgi:hypothetical protein